MLIGCGLLRGELGWAPQAGMGHLYSQPVYEQGQLLFGGKGNSTHIGLALSLYCPLLQGHTWHPESFSQHRLPCNRPKMWVFVCCYQPGTLTFKWRLTVPSRTHLWLPRSGFMFLATLEPTRAHFRGGRKGP